MRYERDPCVYILASAFHGTLYVGVTSHLLLRIALHREEVFDGFTKRYGIKRLVHFEMFATMREAIMREKQLKHARRDWTQALIERENPQWDDLAAGFDLPPATPPPSGELEPGTMPG